MKNSISHFIAIRFGLLRLFVTIILLLERCCSSNSSSHDCLRPCVQLEQSKTCTYKFFVGKAAGGSRGDDAIITSQRVINGTSPGPPIEICLGDRIEVIVENGLSSEELSFHWHGLRQKGSPHMDGVSMISQCPIMPYTSFRYKFKPESSGTFFYHAHSVRQQGDGLYGSLIVRSHQDNSIDERILVVSARSSSSLSEILYLEDKPPVPQALILNGQTTKNVGIRIESGKTYLLRLINANVFNCPISFFIAKHNLVIIATDGHLVDSSSNSSSAERIIIFPGERFDVAVRTYETPAVGRYVIGFQGFQDCRGLIHEATLIYEKERRNRADTNETPTLVRADESYMNHADEEAASHEYYCNVKFGPTKTVCSLNLRGNLTNNDDDDDNEDDDSEREKQSSIEKLYVPFDIHSYNDIHDRMTDYSFNIYEFSYYPSFLSGIAPSIGQVNRMTFDYPASPMLSQPMPDNDDALCSIEKRSKLCNNEREEFFCQCTQILRLPSYRTFDIYLIDEGFGGNTSHTFHVHGYDVGIVGIGQFERPTRKEEIVEMNDKGLPLPHRDYDAFKGAALLRKDSFVVPNKGYLILRIHTDNIGYWLWEARSTGLYGGNNGQPPMQFVMLVGNRENLPTVPINFPRCGNHKSPASIFHDA